MKPSKRAEIVKNIIEILEKENAIDNYDKFSILLSVSAATIIEDEKFGIQLYKREA